MRKRLSWKLTPNLFVIAKWSNSSLQALVRALWYVHNACKVKGTTNWIRCHTQMSTFEYKYKASYKLQIKLDEAPIIIYVAKLNDKEMVHYSHYRNNTLMWLNPLIRIFVPPTCGRYQMLGFIGRVCHGRMINIVY